MSSAVDHSTTIALPTSPNVNNSSISNNSVSVFVPPQVSQVSEVKQDAFCASTSPSAIMLNASLHNKKFQMLVDSGSSYSILPKSFINGFRLTPSSTVCYTANGQRLHFAGESCVPIKIAKLRRNTPFVFLFADVKIPLIGLDFLSNFQLMIDCSTLSIIDKVTGRTIQGAPTTGTIPNYSFSVKSDVHPVVKSLLEKYPSLLAPIQLKDLTPSKSNFYHRIETGDASPVSARARPLAPQKLEAVKREFQELLEAGVISPSSSSWSSPIHLVQNPDSSYRVVGDLRSLNSITKIDAYPMASMSSLSTKLHGAKIFSKLDLRKAYNLIKIHPLDTHKTAVVSPIGFFEYNSLAFGLRNAGAAFQRFIDNIFREINNIFIYIDDCLLYSETLEEHTLLLEKVMKILSEHNLRLSFDKCEFSSHQLHF